MIHRALAIPDRIIWVNPINIEYAIFNMSKKILGNRKVRGGYWDQIKVPVKKKIGYLFYEEVFVEGLTPENTTAFAYWKRLVKSGVHWRGCNNVTDITERIIPEKLLLYDSISRRGFLEPEEITRLENTSSTGNYVSVCIARNGEILFGPGGINRLAIAKILGIDRIPVKVRLRHSEWQRTRQYASTLASREKKRSHSVIHPDVFELHHPDLRDIVDAVYE